MEKFTPLAEYNGRRGDDPDPLQTLRFNISGHDAHMSCHLEANVNKDGTRALGIWLDDTSFRGTTVMARYLLPKEDLVASVDLVDLLIGDQTSQLPLVQSRIIFAIRKAYGELPPSGNPLEGLLEEKDEEWRGKTWSSESNPGLWIRLSKEGMVEVRVPELLFAVRLLELVSHAMQ